MNALTYLAVDLVAIALLVTVYFRRHHRRDLLVSYLCINIGVFAVTTVLAESTVAAGLGLGLFGVLSIIRLRSSEIAQHEVAYYFAALAIGLLGGFGAYTGSWLPATLIAAMVVLLGVVDHGKVLRGYRQQVVVVDRAIADEAELSAHLGGLLGAEIKSVEVQRLDLVNDTTVVDVRYRVPHRPTAPERPAEAPAAERISR